MFAHYFDLHCREDMESNSRFGFTKVVDALYIDIENLNGLIDYTTELIYYLSKKDVILSCN